MGSYYPWLYFQFWLLLPCFLYLTKHIRIKLWHAITFSFLIEIVFNQVSSISLFINYSDLAWRLFVGRYVFIIYIGFLICENQFKYIKMLPLILIGLIITILQRYEMVDFSILYFTPQSIFWKGFHWQMYFYSAFLFVLLKKSLPKLPERINIILKWTGRNSWEIFLSQMLYFHIFRLADFQFFNLYLSAIIFIVFSVLSCMIIALAYIKLRDTIRSSMLNMTTTNHQESK